MSHIGTRFCIVFLIALTAKGCAAPPDVRADAPRQAAQSSGKAPIAVDTSKAFLPLDQIDPKVEPPSRSTQQAPLPERAAEPIATSRKLIAQQRYTEAALELERALRYAPAHPEIFAHLAMLHWQAGNLERAKSSVEQTVNGNPQSVIGHYILGRCLASTGDRPGAMKELRTAILCADFESDAEVAALIHFHLAEMLAEEGYLTAAIGQYEAFGRESARATPAPKGELASLLATRRGSVEQSKADMLEKLGRNDEAAQVLRPIADRAPEDVALQVRYARLLFSSNQTDQAAAALARLKTDDQQVLDLLIEIRKKSGQSDMIEQDLRARLQSNPDSAYLADRLAKVLADSERSDDAAKVLGEFLHRHPDNAAIRQTQLSLLVKSKRWNEALKLSAEKLRNDPASEKEVESILEAVRASPEAVDGIIASANADSKDPIHLYLVSRVAAQAHRPEDAERVIQNALTLDSDFAPARAAMAELLVGRCDLEGALKFAARTNPETPDDARLERALGLIYDRLDDTEKADFHYRAAIQLDRADKRSMYALANVYRKAKKPLQAQRQLRSLLEIDPSHEPARELLAVALLEEGKGESARIEFQQLEKLTQKATTRARCRILLEADPALRANAKERRRILLEAIEVSGPDAPAWLAVAETYEDSEPQKAREYFLKAAALDPDEEEALMGALRTDQYELRFDRVATGLEEMLRCRPNRHNWRRILIGMYSLLEQFDRAVGIATEQEARTDLDGARRAEYREALVDALKEAGRRDEAIERLKAWAAEDGDGKEWTQRLALEYVRQRRHHDAVKVYESLHEVAPDNRAIRDRLLDALQETKQDVRAEQYLVRWFAEDPQNDRLILALAHIISRAGRVDEAIELINTWLLRTTRRESYQDLLVSELAAAGRHEDCAQLLEELADEITTVIRFGGDVNRMPSDDQLTDERRARRPNEPFAMDRLHDRLEFLRLRRIVGLGNAKRFREAQQLLDTLMQGNPEPDEKLRLLYSQATLSRLAGEPEDADSAMEQVLALKPRDESLSNDLSYAWIDRGIRLDEAEPLIRFSVGRIPRQAAYLDTYGWLLYKKGNLEEAKTWLMRANRVRGGDDPVIHDHLGDTYWRLGERDAAIARWQMAVELVKDRTDIELTNDDERRVKRETKQKIDDAATSEGPKIAPLAKSEEPKTEPRP